MLKISTVRKWIVYLLVFYFFFYPQILIIAGGKFLYLYLGTVIFLSVVCLVTRDSYNGIGSYQWGWILILVVSTFRNEGIQHHDYLWPMTFITLIIALIVLGQGYGWIESFCKVAVIFGMVYVLSCIVFYVVPSLYDKMISFWGYYPNGTEFGRYGYRAGLADNHSANATYCVVPFLIGGSSLLCGAVQKHRRCLVSIIVILSGIAVILTTKRAHLIFGFLVELIIYYYYVPKKKANKLFKLLFMVTLALAVLQFVQNIPYFSNLLEGFSDQGMDVSNGRFEYWIYALTLFKSNPFMGIGWLGFRYNSSVLLRGTNTSGINYVDAHNVYIQLLCESGIVVAVIIIGFLIYFVVSTLHFYIKNREIMFREQKKALTISFALQLFCLIYGLTGNFLYDRTCFLYIFGCTLFCSMHKAVMKYIK